MKTINELEFIGESLPTINDNFTELNTNINSVSTKTTSLVSLSSVFYTNYSTSFSTDIITVPSPTLGVQKLNIINSLNAYSNVAYPLSIYLTLKYSTLPAASDYVKFSVIGKTGQPKTQVAYGDIPVANRDILYTFTDLGFYNWFIEYPSANLTSSFVTIVVKHT